MRDIVHMIDFNTYQDRPKPRLIEPAFPAETRVTAFRLKSFEMAGWATYAAERARFDLSNGWAEYRVTGEDDGYLLLELVSSEVG